MRELILMRHGKSSWDDPSLDDFDRPLAPRGRKAASRMGTEIAARGWLPDHVVVSAALRTRQTWRRVATELGGAAPRPQYDETLYMASADRMLAIVRAVPADVSRVLLVGHNPGMEDLARGLAGPGSDAEALAAMRAKFPTAALAGFELDGGWAGVGFAAARLRHFLRPRTLD
ncbi:SixA phosphatase family protein [Nitratireductor luteus]|uniref:SixA phosphatase family protein n=1 Tax=Nitratireductor luteus TaxID=2976980 RepID=UPI0022401B90|nr:histidine phosphatase family protein [Nitratireductor luteus]